MTVEAAEPKARSPGSEKGLSIAELVGHGRAHLRLFDIEGYEESVAFFQQALSKAPEFAPAHAGLAEAYSYWGFRQEVSGEESESFYGLAVEHAEKALSLAPERADSHRAMAVALRCGEKADSSRRLQEAAVAVDLDPNDGENWYELWRVRGYNPKSEDIRQALELAPDLCGAHLDLGVALCEAGSLREALNHLIKAIQLSPRNALAHYNAAMVLDRLGHGSRGIELLARAQKMHPDDSLIREGLSILQAPGGSDG